MTEYERRLTLKRKYLEQIEYLDIEDFQQEFNNCSVFRILLYTLGERLLKFIEKEFQKFIDKHSLSDKKPKIIIEKIRDEVRSSPAGSSSKRLKEKFQQRRNKINKLNEDQIKASDWRTIAKCYTASFLMDKEAKFDPKDLLDILIHCSLFSPDLGNAALLVVDKRNHFYGHISALVIDSAALETIKSAIKSLMKHIPAQNIDYND